MPFAQTVAGIDRAASMPVAFAFQNASLLTVLYAPSGEDVQEPHEQDEVYVVAQGHAVLEVGAARTTLSAGDAAFVAAKAQHRFVDMSPDFAAWAVFPR